MKQRVHFVNENEKHINHYMSGRAERKTKGREEKKKNPETSIASCVPFCSSSLCRVSVEGRTSWMFQVRIMNVVRIKLQNYFLSEKNC